MYYQTGDVLYFKEKKLPAKTEIIKTDLFHKGDNHHHRVRGDFEIHKKDGEMYLVCNSECELYHEEHTSIKCEAGIYRKQIVMEYDHLLKESRMVID